MNRTIPAINVGRAAKYREVLGDYQSAVSKLNYLEQRKQDSDIDYEIYINYKTIFDEAKQNFSWSIASSEEYRVTDLSTYGEYMLQKPDCDVNLNGWENLLKLVMAKPSFRDWLWVYTQLNDGKLIRLTKSSDNRTKMTSISSNFDVSASGVTLFDMVGSTVVPLINGQRIGLDFNIDCLNLFLGYCVRTATLSNITYDASSIKKFRVTRILGGSFTISGSEPSTDGKINIDDIYINMNDFINRGDSSNNKASNIDFISQHSRVLQKKFDRLPDQPLVDWNSLKNLVASLHNIKEIIQ